MPLVAVAAYGLICQGVVAQPARKARPAAVQERPCGYAQGAGNLGFGVRGYGGEGLGCRCAGFRTATPRGLATWGLGGAGTGMQMCGGLKLQVQWKQPGEGLAR